MQQADWGFRPSCHYSIASVDAFPDSKVHGTNVGPIWGRQELGGLHVGHMNLVISVGMKIIRGGDY